MKRTRLCLSTLLGLLVFLVAPMVQAAVPITVTIDGVTACSANDTCTIPDGTYGNVTITGNTAGTQAVVIAVSDSTQDRLEFRNAKIKATSTGVARVITFQGDFNDPPNGNWYYRVRGRTNSFTDRNGPGAGGAAVNSWVKLVGWFSQGGSTFQLGGTGAVLIPTTGMTITALTANSVFSSTTTLNTPFTNVSTAPRTLKGELSFRVVNTNDTLKIPDLPDLVTIHSSAVPGPGEPDPCADAETVCGPPVTITTGPSATATGCLPPSHFSWWARFTCAVFGSCPDNICE